MAQGSAKSSSGSRKRWKFEFGPAGMAGLCAVVLLVMAWAFILGILVGRGYKPESVVEELSRVVPPLGGDQAEKDSGPLLPEELRFFETLQEKVAPALPAARTEPEKAAAAPKPAPATQKAAQAERTQQPAAAPAQPPAAPAPASPGSGQPPRQSQGPVFDYVYQVAAFQSDGQARSMQQRIMGLGIAASVESSLVNGEKWHRVLVSLRGTSDDAVAMKQELQKLGIERPFIRTKKPL